MEATRKLTAAQVLYRSILDGNFGRDVEFIANVILTSASKPATKLGNLLERLRDGDSIRCGNSTDSININGTYYYGLGILDKGQYS